MIIRYMRAACLIYMGVGMIFSKDRISLRKRKNSKYAFYYSQSNSHYSVKSQTDLVLFFSSELSPHALKINFDVSEKSPML